jgi:hypothetical protein
MVDLKESSLVDIDRMKNRHVFHRGRARSASMSQRRADTRQRPASVPGTTERGGLRSRMADIEPACELRFQALPV